MNYNFMQLSAQDIKHRADEMRPLIERLAEKFPEGMYNFYGVIEKFMSSAWTCWIVEEDDEITSMAATAVYPNMDDKVTLKIIFTVARRSRNGVDKNIMMDCLDYFKSQCLANGISEIEIIGREGWKPALVDKGFVVGCRVYTLDVTKEDHHG
jgi:hypothetical protein